MLYFFYGFYFLIVGTAAFLCYRRVRKHGQAKGLAAGGATVLLLTLFFPVPIHGGFTTMIDIMLSELDSWKTLRRYAVNEKKKAAFVQGLQTRQKGPLPFTRQRRQTEHWWLVQTTGGQSAWYDREEELLWTLPLLLESHDTRPTLDQARSFCAGLAPAGYWALPSEAELFLFWRNKGPEISAWAPAYSSISFISDPDLQTEMATYFFGKRPDFAVRCLARATKIPPSVTTSRDIPLAQWNEFQLNKASLYQGF